MYRTKQWFNLQRKIMKAKTRILLEEAQRYCDDNDKSTEFMLQYMQDFAGVDLDCVVNFLQKQSKLCKQMN